MKTVSGCSTWIAQAPHQISSWSAETCARKWSQQVLLSTDLETTSPDHWKESKMLEVNGASTYAGTKEFGYNVCHWWPTIQFFCLLLLLLLLLLFGLFAGFFLFCFLLLFFCFVLFLFFVFGGGGGGGGGRHAILPASQTKTTDNLDRYVTHIDKKS